MAAAPQLPDPIGHPHIKICGLRRPQDALLALELGASFLGVIFAEGTPRCLETGEAAALLDEVRAKAKVPVRPIGVFVHEPIEHIRALVKSLGLAAVQLHAPKPEEDFARFPVPVIRAVRVRGEESRKEIESAMGRGPVLLDAFVEGRHGGTGRVFDHDLAIPHIPKGKVFIAGGLNPDNIGGVAQALANAGALPYAFDASSGLEVSAGIKSDEKLKTFFASFTDVVQSS